MPVEKREDGLIRAFRSTGEKHEREEAIARFGQEVGDVGEVAQRGFDEGSGSW